MKRKLLKSIALLLFMGMSSVFCVNSVYADFFDDYEFINCPDGMLFDPVVAQCEWASGEDSEDDYVCLVRNKILGIDVIVFACKPETKEPSCKATYESATIECNCAKNVVSYSSRYDIWTVSSAGRASA